MRNPLTATSSAGTQRIWALGSIAFLAWLVAVLFGLLIPPAAARGNEFFYDLFYHARPEADLTGDRGNVVLVAADQSSITAVNETFGKGWPWPREYWGHIASYIDKAGAKAIIFDIVFVETSAHAASGDDDIFADAMNELKTPVVYGAEVKADGDKGAWAPFAPPIKNPTFGAVNVGNEKIYRKYLPVVRGLPSLASRTVTTVGSTLPEYAAEPFLLHYYGPHQRADGKSTFTYLQAARVLGAQVDTAKSAAYGIKPEMFKDKIVILCATALGTFDMKSSPLSAEYPGPEVQATAIENLLRGQRVATVPGAIVSVLTLAMAAAVAAGVILPRKAVLKAVVPVVCVAGVLLLSVVLFRGETIRWLPPLEPLLGMAIATPLAFSWTYFAEDRQRRFMLKALSKVVSPTVAQQLSREPERLARATVRSELTILFSDLAGFTDLSEGMDVQQLGEFMNRYLGAMSDEVLSQDGTLDKYIGDAVMAFWNAPLNQADHAARACRAALRMVRREKELFAQMQMPAGKTYTRIGINTAGVAVGFIGSEHLFNYTCLGDGVNLASRLEGANKIYGSRILLSHHTAVLVKDRFWLRQVDVLRVKGKKEPMAVYELLGERGPGDAANADDQRYQGLTAAYATAFAAYQARHWDEAEKHLLELSVQFGQDGPADALLARVREYRSHPPEPSWDGVYVSATK